MVHSNYLHALVFIIIYRCGKLQALEVLQLLQGFEHSENKLKEGSSALSRQGVLCPALVSAMDANGDTALHLACEISLNECCRLLIDIPGIDINALNVNTGFLYKNIKICTLLSFNLIVDHLRIHLSKKV